MVGHALKKHAIDALDDDGLLWIYYKVSIWSTVVAKESLEWNCDFAISKSFSLAPCAVL